MTYVKRYNGVSPTADIGEGSYIAADAVIMDGAKLGQNAKVEPGVIIYENVQLGANSFIGAQSILGERLLAYLKVSDYVNPALEIGDNAIIRSGTIIYADSKIGNDFQTGHRAVIREKSILGNNCSFGTMSQLDGSTTIGNNCRFHNNVFIATYMTIEDDVHFYPMSCTTDSLHPPCQIGRQGPYVERGAIIGAKVLLLPRVRIGAGAIVAGASVVSHDVPPNAVVAGVPAKFIKNKDEVRCHLEDRPAYEVALESIK